MLKSVLDSNNTPNEPLDALLDIPLLVCFNNFFGVLDSEEMLYFECSMKSLIRYSHFLKINPYKIYKNFQFFFSDVQ